MNTQRTTASLRWKVGLFALLGLFLISAVTIYVNDRPFWWRPCQLVHINIEDATGLRTKSPIRSLGLQIGYLESVDLFETYVRLGICITAPVDVLPATRAYIKGEGFLGDKFVELKPVKYTGPARDEGEDSKPGVAPAPEAPAKKPAGAWLRTLDRWVGIASRVLIGPEAFAQKPPTATTAKNRRDIPVGENQQDVQKLVEQVDGLVGEMKQLTNNLKEAINPNDLRRTMQQLNRTLENASKTLSPAGGLNTTAQRTLEKLEDGIEQLRDIMTRVNKGEGSVGMLLNDPVYAQEIRETIRNVNLVINRLSRVRVNMDLMVEQIEHLESGNNGRGYININIWPVPTRYYRLGIASDPRGAFKVVDYATTVGSSTTNVRTVQTEQGGLVLTAMLGKVFYDRFDLAVGLQFGDGTLSLEAYAGPMNRERMVRIHGDVYTRGRGIPMDERAYVVVQPFIGSALLGPLYLRGGLESFRQQSAGYIYSIGAGITFDDEDLRVLFAFR